MKKIYFLFVALLLTLGAGAQTLRGDVNGDGTVDVADVTELVDIILNGNDEEEPDTDSRAIDLGLPSGIKWASRNVGATVPEEYGGYYAWGETEEKSSYYESNYLYYSNGSYTNIGSDISGTQYDVAHVKWGGSWRMPTPAEQRELRYNCTWTWTTLNGVNGYRVTGPNGNSIFLPAAGYRCDSEAYGQGTLGYYWLSFLSFSSRNAEYLYFDYIGNDCGINGRCCGQSVRPVSE